MNRKKLCILMGGEFALLLLLVLLTDEFPALFSSLTAFPFEQVGAGLRALALCGGIGNGLALMLWAGLSLLPLLPVLRHKGELNRRYESAALVFLSISLFLVLRGMADPATLYSPLLGGADAALPVMKAVMGSVVWSIAALWVVLRLLRLFRAGDTGKLLGYLQTMLCALCILFTAVIALSCGAALFSGLADARRGLDCVMAGLRFLVAALPYVMDIAITLSAMPLLEALLSEDTANAAELADGLSRLCCLALGVVSASVAGLNLLQLILARGLSDVAVTVAIPVTSLAFVLAALLVARLIADNRRLQHDNDLFI